MIFLITERYAIFVKRTVFVMVSCAVMYNIYIVNTYCSGANFVDDFTAFCTLKSTVLAQRKSKFVVIVRVIIVSLI